MPSGGPTIPSFSIMSIRRAARPYPGWKNMTKAGRREFFGYKYEGEVAPLTMLTPESQAAAAAGEE